MTDPLFHPALYKSPDDAWAIRYPLGWSVIGGDKPWQGKGFWSIQFVGEFAQLPGRPRCELEVRREEPPGAIIGERQGVVNGSSWATHRLEMTRGDYYGFRLFSFNKDLHNSQVEAFHASYSYRDGREPFAEVALYLYVVPGLFRRAEVYEVLGRANRRDWDSAKDLLIRFVSSFEYRGKP